MPLVPWSLTLGPTVAANVRLHGTSPWHLQESRCCLAANVKLHGARPWHLVRMAGLNSQRPLAVHPQFQFTRRTDLKSVPLLFHSHLIQITRAKLGELAKR